MESVRAFITKHAIATVAIVILIVILLIYSHIRALGDIDAGLYGFWAIDTDFADKAYIDAMYMYIEPPGRRASNNIGMFGATCDIYVVLKIDGAIAFNKRVPVAIRRTTPWPTNTYKYRLDFGSDINRIPSKVTAEYDPTASMLTINDSKTMYARLFKRPELSFYATASTDPNEKMADDEVPEVEVAKNDEAGDE